MEHKTHITQRALRLAVAGSTLAWAAIAPAATPWSAQDYELYAGDFNGDGRTDMLFIAREASQSSGIAVADESGLSTLWQSWSSAYLGIQWSGGAHGAVVGDFNGDGKSDVLLQRAAPGDSYLLLADANGRLTGISQTIPHSHLGLGWSRDRHTILGGDFSGDGRADLFLQAADPSGIQAVPLADDGGLFVSSPEQVFTDSSWPAFKWSRRDSVITVGDFNGDGRADLLIQSQPHEIEPNFFGVVYSQGGAAPFQQAGVQQWSRHSLGVDWSPLHATAVVGDFNNDGRDDVLLQARSPGSPHYLLLGNASGAAFSSPTAVTIQVSASSDRAKLLAGRFGDAGAGLYVQAMSADGVNYVAPVVGRTTTTVAHDPGPLSMPGAAGTLAASNDARGAQSSAEGVNSAAAAAATTSSTGSETVTYSYDARGRLKTVTRTGGVNNGVQVQYTYDKANNRKTVVTSGSANPPPSP